MATQTASELLAEAQKQQAEINAKVESLLKQTRDEDLITAKRLVKLHSFTAKDLEMRARTASRAAAKSTPRKTTRKK